MLKDLLILGSVVGFLGVVFAVSALFTKKEPKDSGKENENNK